MNRSPKSLNKATRLLRAGRAAEALKIYHAVLKSEPRNAAAYRGLATLALAAGKAASAAALALRALAIEPDNQQAAEIFRRVLEALDSPREVAQLYYEYSLDLRAKGRLQAALINYRRGLRFDPALAAGDDHRAARLLAAGDLANGWMAYEWRDTVAGLGPFTERLWNGQDLAAKTILVWGEQGIGDHLMFANCLPDLIAAAGRVIIETDRRLVALLARSFPAAMVHGAGRYTAAGGGDGDLAWLKDYPEPDFLVPMGSLPRFFRPTIESFPKRGGRLLADAGRTAAWRDRLAAAGAGRKKVGISWRSLLMTEETAAFFPALDNWRPLLGLTGIDWINLQAGGTEGETREFKDRYGIDLITPEGLDLADDLDGVAALTGALDAVVTAGSYIKWLAAALAVPTWSVVRGDKTEDWALLGQPHYPWFPNLKGYFATGEEDLRRIFETIAAEIGSGSV